LLVGVVSALVLFALDELAAVLEHGIWDALPDALQIDPASPGWIIGVLTLTGAAVGLSIQFLPGHGGEDSATTELVATPLRPRVLPSLALVTLLGLAGGVSLGPENPIIAINTGILVALVARLWPRVPVGLVVLVTAAATIGAMFGTPIAAALVLTGVVAGQATGGAVWDRLFLPLVAAGAGAFTTALLSHPSFAIDLGGYDRIVLIDIVSAVVVAAIAAALGVVASVLMPRLHHAFRLLRQPAIYVTIGGLVLGILGAIGGPVTLFKGLHQMNDLVAGRSDYASGELVLIVLVKVTALVIAAACGFRGGRIFPAVFVGVALGVLVNALAPAIPLTVAVAASAMGIVLAVSRDGWIAIFIAVAITGGVTVIPLLCIAILPAWLLVSRAPEMIVHVPTASAQVTPKDR
jgi:H+/Cl- antiporter ClcA